MRGVMLCVALILACLNFSCSKKVVAARPRAIGHSETGIASWYGEPYHGRRTASGDVYDMHRMTAAHRTLPFQTWVQVRNLDNGDTTEVRINDRGPFIDGRIVDLSRAAAGKIRMLQSGTARVRLTVIRSPAKADATTRFAIQIAAFADTKRARRFRESISKSHPGALVLPTGNGRESWRVLVGSEADRRVAEEFAEALRRDFPAAMVVSLPE